MFSRIISYFVLITFLTTSVVPPSYAQTVLDLPVPGTMIKETSSFVPLEMKGLMVHQDNPLAFDFIMDTGDTGMGVSPELKDESDKIIKYFLAALTVPEDQVWVNLSPYEKDRIVAQSLGQTEMGRDLLAQDYMLKQLTSSLMDPQDELGKKFWERVYSRAQEIYGNTDLPLNTFNKIWIVPNEAQVYEKDTTAYIVDRKLKVMLEEDYVALAKNKGLNQFGLDSLKEEDTKSISQAQSEVIRTVLIPEIEREINEGQTFAKLRQIYDAMILATWYKVRLKESLLGKIYVDQNKVDGVNANDPQINEKIWEQYVQSFKTGVFNLIQEDYDPTTQSLVPRKYFSGGVATYNPDKGMLSDIIRNSILNVAAAALLAIPSSVSDSQSGFKSHVYKVVINLLEANPSTRDVMQSVNRRFASRLERTFARNILVFYGAVKNYSPAGKTSQESSILNQKPQGQGFAAKNTFKKPGVRGPRNRQSRTQTRFLNQDRAMLFRPLVVTAVLSVILAVVIQVKAFAADRMVALKSAINKEWKQPAVVPRLSWKGRETKINTDTIPSFFDINGIALEAGQDVDISVEHSGKLFTLGGVISRIDANGVEIVLRTQFEIEEIYGENIKKVVYAPNAVDKSRIQSIVVRTERIIEESDFNLDLTPDKEILLHYGSVSSQDQKRLKNKVSRAIYIPEQLDWNIKTDTAGNAIQDGYITIGITIPNVVRQELILKISSLHADFILLGETKIFKKEQLNYFLRNISQELLDSRSRLEAAGFIPFSGKMFVLTSVIDEGGSVFGDIKVDFRQYRWLFIDSYGGKESKLSEMSRGGYGDGRVIYATFPSSLERNISMVLSSDGGSHMDGRVVSLFYFYDRAMLSRPSVVTAVLSVILAVAISVKAVAADRMVVLKSAINKEWKQPVVVPQVVAEIRQKEVPQILPPDSLSLDLKSYSSILREWSVRDLSELDTVKQYLRSSLGVPDSLTIKLSMQSNGSAIFDGDRINVVFYAPGINQPVGSLDIAYPVANYVQAGTTVLRDKKAVELFFSRVQIMSREMKVIFSDPVNQGYQIYTSGYHPEGKIFILLDKKGSKKLFTGRPGSVREVFVDFTQYRGPEGRSIRWGISPERMLLIIEANEYLKNQKVTSKEFVEQLKIILKKLDPDYEDFGLAPLAGVEGGDKQKPVDVQKVSALLAKKLKLKQEIVEAIVSDLVANDISLNSELQNSPEDQRTWNNVHFMVIYDLDNAMLSRPAVLAVLSVILAVAIQVKAFAADRMAALKSAINKEWKQPTVVPQVVAEIRQKEVPQILPPDSLSIDLSVYQATLTHWQAASDSAIYAVKDYLRTSLGVPGDLKIKLGMQQSSGSAVINGMVQAYFYLADTDIKMGRLDIPYPAAGHVWAGTTKLSNKKEVAQFFERVLQMGNELKPILVKNQGYSLWISGYRADGKMFMFLQEKDKGVNGRQKFFTGLSGLIREVPMEYTNYRGPLGREIRWGVSPDRLGDIIEARELLKGTKVTADQFVDALKLILKTSDPDYEDFALAPLAGVEGGENQKSIDTENVSKQLVKQLGLKQELVDDVLSFLGANVINLNFDPNNSPEMERVWNGAHFTVVLDYAMMSKTIGFLLLASFWLLSLLPQACRTPGVVTTPESIYMISRDTLPVMQMKFIKGHQLSKKRFNMDGSGGYQDSLQRKVQPIDSSKMRLDTTHVLAVFGLMNYFGNKSYGGINLSSKLLDLQIKRDAKGIPLPFDQQDFDKLKDVKGFLPIIIDIKPIMNLPQLLGLNPDGSESSSDQQLSFYGAEQAIREA